MPLPLVLMSIYEVLVALVAWVARRKAWEVVVGYKAADFATRFIADEQLAEVVRKMERVAADMVQEQTGLPLNGELSVHGFANAFVSLTGIPIRNLFDRDMLREDLESFALDQLQAKSGYRLSSLTDAEKVKGDLQAIGLTILQNKSGVPVAGAQNADDMRRMLIDWAEPIIYQRLQSQVGVEGVTAETLVSAISARVKDKHGRPYSNRQIVTAINAQIAANTVSSAIEFNGTDKVTRRRLQLRWAQKKFRERHKGRSLYVPLGFVADVSLIGGGGDDGS
ncbi:MAG: hypothetical protein J5X22_09390 [Candidatus Accumulibacter sp.]|uniref:hypothetical protein n=1 Tax=Accumulibacter sp. TaxID=2053492 RepID=UPI001ACF95C1|nr:hypothetical protein [Accumulibacter sp.]MBN8516802.1 hypothetical protein [Accumulibacter sp.]MBO3710715.1 hypothetical protein [Accumulibacter sp.]